MIAIRTALLSIAFGVLFVSAAGAGDAPRAFLVLDASGSMWGQIEGRTKIEIAREVVNGILGNWDSDVELGLIAYGHRRKGDCEDIETLLNPAQPDASRIKDIVTGLNPKGKTPLTRSVIMAAQALRYTEEKATVILVSDGKETCAMDPCAIGKELEQAGVDFTAHVISFDVPEKDTAGLRCLAESTGGLFLSAKDASSLEDALGAAVEQAAAVEPEPEPVDEATLAAPDTVAAGSGFKVAWTGPADYQDKVGVFGPGEDGKRSDSKVVGERNPLKLRAPEKPGEYEVRYTTAKGRVLARAPLQVTAVTASLEAPDTVAAGSGFKVVWTGPANDKDKVAVFGLGEDGKRFDLRFLREKNPVKLRAPEGPGEYELRYVTRQGRVLARASLQVTAVTASLEVPETVAAGSGFKVGWTGPANAQDTIGVFAPGEDGRRFDLGGVGEKNPLKLRAPEVPGEYEVRYSTGKGRVLVREPLQVKAVTASLEAPETVAAGSGFKVGWTGPANAQDTIGVFAPGEDGRRFDLGGVGEKNPLKLRAPEEPGEYEVRYSTGKGRVLARSSLQVTAVTASLEAPESVAAGSGFKVGWKGPANAQDTIGVYGPGEDGRRFDLGGVGEKNPLKLRAPEEPGEYEVRYSTAKRRVLARSSLQVTAVTASLEAPESVAAGSGFKVGWKGPANAQDTIGVFGPGEDGRRFDLQGVGEKNPLKLRAPEKPSEYEVRYSTGKGRVLARVPLQVTAVTAALEAPETVAAGSGFKVSWTGPANGQDTIGVFGLGDDGRRFDLRVVGDKNPLKLQAPKEPGEYEVRYSTPKGRVLTRKPLLVN